MGKGNLEIDSNSPNYKTVTFLAPQVPEGDSTVRVGVKIADGLGYVGFQIITIKVLDTDNTEPDNPAPMALVGAPINPIAGTPYLISLQISDQDVNGNDTSHLLNTDLYYSVDGGEFVEIVKGLRGKHDDYLWIPKLNSDSYRLKLVTTDGNKKTEYITGNDDNIFHTISGTVFGNSGIPLAPLLNKLRGFFYA